MSRTLLLICALLGLPGTHMRAQDMQIELEQLPDKVLEHQRFPGNERAQAERRGIIRKLPQLFVYHADGRHSPAFHLHGFRPGFERQLALVLDDFRVNRGMVPLEDLLENARRPDGSRLEIDELPERHEVFVIYTGPDCAACETLEQALAAWLDQQPARPRVRIRITVHGPGTRTR
ncbi:MAG: hypothetical protein Kow0020_08090 [Wenzhouxiangellaceae bacterium]